MLTALAAFVNAHFHAVLGGILAESAILATVYSAVTSDVAFALGLVVITAVVGFTGLKAFTVMENMTNINERVTE